MQTTQSSQEAVSQGLKAPLPQSSKAGHSPV